MRSLILLALAAAQLLAQSTDSIVHNITDLNQREAKLLTAAKASPSGNAFDTFDDLGSTKTLLVVRVHTGDAELHQQWADQMVILKGTITLVTGGAVQQGHTTAPGETRGPGIEGGKEVGLHPGDIARIAANVPHWVKLAPGTTTAYLVFKEKDNEEDKR
jgi:mannose-6-phosphate isomerase-like protein (cupin superfamily)